MSIGIEATRAATDATVAPVVAALVDAARRPGRPCRPARDERGGCDTLDAMTPREHVPLAPHCTMGVGGPARFFVEASDEAAAIAAWRWAALRGVPLRVLGGGSNLVASDEGVDGLVVKIAIRGLRATPGGAEIELVA